ncbi:Cof-type HAD-IIB family hydrolase [Atopobacter phocae]|uniref:Cof-type HAD-IIB family hydrolase n=1 Tax=Atopobacter phocae TaxID=136492 RepID=UPI00046E98D3|nr:Cof-type HAD-IIB family hydrolase [Atopobacter phocae]
MNSNQYKGVIFFDLDGTLLDAKSQINQSAQEAIKALKAANYLPVIATGRSYFEVKDKINAVGIDTLVGLNGAIGILNDELIFHEDLPQVGEEKLIAAAEKLGHKWTAYNHEYRYCNGHSEMMKKCYQLINESLPEANEELLQKMNKQMILLMTDSDDEWYEKQVPELSFYRNIPYAIDIVAKDMNKAKGIQKMLNYLNMPLEHTYAFGDGRNDIEMFELIPNTIAMENAIDALKDIATFVTTHHNQTGILDGLKHFNIILKK